MRRSECICEGCTNLLKVTKKNPCAQFYGSVLFLNRHETTAVSPSWSRFSPTGGGRSLCRTQWDSSLSSAELHTHAASPSPPSGPQISQLTLSLPLLSLKKLFFFLVIANVHTCVISHPLRYPEFINSSWSNYSNWPFSVTLFHLWFSLFSAS